MSIVDEYRTAIEIMHQKELERMALSRPVADPAAELQAIEDYAKSRTSIGMPLSPEEERELYRRYKELKAAQNSQIIQPNTSIYQGLKSAVGIQVGKGDTNVKISMTPPMPPKDELQRTLCVRLRMQQGEGFPLEFIDFHVAADKVYVFTVSKGGAAIIEDDRNLFPSDSLITALRLLAE
jgi:hypothetical protein